MRVAADNRRLGKCPHAIGKTVPVHDEELRRQGGTRDRTDVTCTLHTSRQVPRREVRFKSGCFLLFALYSDSCEPAYTSRMLH